jgi:hypothetical protein
MSDYPSMLRIDLLSLALLVPLSAAAVGGIQGVSSDERRPL